MAMFMLTHLDTVGVIDLPVVTSLAPVVRTVLIIEVTPGIIFPFYEADVCHSRIISILLQNCKEIFTLILTLHSLAHFLRSAHQSTTPVNYLIRHRG